ncbi:putative endonuclease [Legionella quinlivanii]|uniref:Putative endonuclease n=1 Tax=Legionella quinlivanii TaxID=45073 RepID=A0A0W0XLD4_9GAMM|nr:GIY-YIG nuclease family protein [Legionella quinlivanii]KTD45398.1 putative endonuclease [Legionella quinlivanii]MCW8450441.1 GIY-YIG nuclease family protein [Legionella quinlivanii]STY11379.1 Excinuclease ABC, C subunit-like protein [Legionella quinlivanii]
MKSFYVYMMTSKRNSTLYTGSTSDLIRRVWEHKNQVIPGFTAKYNVHLLVYYEMHDTYVEAARRERRFKKWPRQWKLNLIEKMNPDWADLYEEICS